MDINRRRLVAGTAALAGLSTLAALPLSIRAAERRIFDSHCHIIDHTFPLIANQGYMPPHFPLEQYLQQATPLGVRAGAVVSGSFQAFDQNYLRSLLPRLGKGLGWRDASAQHHQRR